MNWNNISLNILNPILLAIRDYILSFLMFPIYFKIQNSIDSIKISHGNFSHCYLFLMNNMDNTGGGQNNGNTWFCYNYHL